MRNTAQKQLFSTAEAAKALGVTDRRIRQLCAAGDFGLKIGDRDWIIPRADLDRERKARSTAG